MIQIESLAHVANEYGIQWARKIKRQNIFCILLGEPEQQQQQSLMIMSECKQYVDTINGN